MNIQIQSQQLAALKASESARIACYSLAAESHQRVLQLIEGAK